ncbi:MAG: tRNA (adenosine(37)-N6)-threonylcarbamoyltransferase complex ATPase subunit type 1 TsaE [Candidatus Omnitrophota bacterium]|nr:MAG: tRNA (adenosine(37)-N6)-threonylcarbamoyltransferase complex ATPase subunit type 1 TsaE [Candidatus Omnitrophota bacterium]HDN97895.1 tRNA (adenosine(37)-N6)-threonylcarbamoyltransferase complex ATPase subunit type 1 TsaE [bacterium]
MEVYTWSPEETKILGEKIAKNLKKGDIVGFIGCLGSGKTTLIKGIVKFLTGKEAISPSFVIIREYEGKIPVYHFDLYRLNDEKELETIGWEDYLERGIILIEWAEKIKNCLPEKTIFVEISIEGRDKRKFTILTPESRKFKI